MKRSIPTASTWIEKTGRAGILLVRLRQAGILLPLLLAACAVAPPGPEYDLVIRGGTIYDGSGGPPFRGDVAIEGDRIAWVGAQAPGTGAKEIDARGLAVAPGFINMLSWATDSLLVDGRGESDLRQGVTLEVMGEGNSMGPLNARMKELWEARQGDIRYDIDWTTLGEYLERLERQGIAMNVASFVGATSVRVYELGEDDVEPSPEQLERMRALVRQAMEEGALGVGSSLIYAPANYAKTDELVAITEQAAACGGMYISHMRNEGNQVLEAIDELINISRESGAPAEIYHLKLAGAQNWPKLPAVIERVESARREGLRITADMYLYTAGATGFDAAMPPWVQDGGLEAWIERLKDPEIRARVITEMRDPDTPWDNLYAKAGPDGILLLGFKNEKLKPLTGKRLSDVARMRGESPEDTAIDLVIEDGSRVGVAYFLMSEENVERQVQLPWVSFGSDEAAQAPYGVFLKSNPHPRAYGNVARLLGHYVRDRGLVPLEEAIRRLTSLPAQNLALHDRGLLEPGYFADVVVFDPARIIDHATYDDPQQFATGVMHVVVNGRLALEGGEPTGELPGRAVRGRAWTGWPDGGCRSSATDWAWTGHVPFAGQ
jgi:N-acyl-D-amino-acid deacylase